MLKIYQRYLAANFIPPFFLTTFFLIFFLMTFQLFRFTKFIVAKGVDLSSLGLLFFHLAVSFLPLATPLSVLFAVLYGLNKLSEDMEIVAMRAFGASRFQLLTPFLIVGLFISGVLFSLNRSTIPHSKRDVRNTYIKLASKAMLKQIRQEEFFGDIPGITMYASSVGLDGREMKDLFLFLSDKKTKEQQIILAREGTLSGGQEGDLSNFQIILKDGSILKRNEKKGELAKIFFETYSFPPFKKIPEVGTISKASMKPNKELKAQIEISRKEYLKALESGDKRQIKERRRSFYRNQLEYYLRINSPIVILGFILLAFSVGARIGSGRQKSSSMRMLFVLIPYYALFFLGVSQVKSGNLNPLIAVFVPTVLFLVVAWWSYKKVDWVS
jgi:lipopolysaccharide export system permease protein